MDLAVILAGHGRALAPDVVPGRHGHARHERRLWLLRLGGGGMLGGGMLGGGFGGSQGCGGVSVWGKLSVLLSGLLSVLLSGPLSGLLSFWVVLCRIVCCFLCFRLCGRGFLCVLFVFCSDVRVVISNDVCKGLVNDIIDIIDIIIITIIIIMIIIIIVSL